MPERGFGSTGGCSIFFFFRRFLRHGVCHGCPDERALRLSRLLCPRLSADVVLPPFGYRAHTTKTTTTASPWPTTCPSAHGRPTTSTCCRYNHRLPPTPREPSEVGEQGYHAHRLISPGRSCRPFSVAMAHFGLGSIVDGYPTSGMQFHPFVRSGPVHLRNVLPTASPP